MSPSKKKRKRKKFTIERNRNEVQVKCQLVTCALVPKVSFYIFGRSLAPNIAKISLFNIRHKNSLSELKLYSHRQSYS